VGLEILKRGEEARCKKQDYRVEMFCLILTSNILLLASCFLPIKIKKIKKRGAELII
jgi:hypothetical protein